MNITFKKEKAKCDSLKFGINDILENQYTPCGYDTKEALKCIIEYAKRKLELLDTI